MSELRRQIIVKCLSREEELAVATNIHNQLMGNPDYRENRIILNMSDARNDGTENEVHVYIFNDSVTDPFITIFGTTLNWSTRRTYSK